VRHTVRIVLAIAAVALTGVLAAAGRAGAAVENLRIAQTLVATDAGPRPEPALRITFTLTAPAETAIRVDRHKATVGGDDVTWLARLAEAGAAPFTNAVVIRRPGAAREAEAAPPTPEASADAVQRLLDLRDRHFPGKPVWNVEAGWQGAADMTPEDVAVLLPRVVIGQIAAGVDRVHWSEQGRGGGDPTCLLGPRNEPMPPYTAYAAMTEMLGGARYVGPTGVNPAIRQHWFVRGGEVILAAWAVAKPLDVSFSSELDAVEVTDAVGRRRTVRPESGYFNLTLTPSVQYLRFPRETETYGAAVRSGSGLGRPPGGRRDADPGRARNAVPAGRGHRAARRHRNTTRAGQARRLNVMCGPAGLSGRGDRGRAATPPVPPATPAPWPSAAAG